MDSRPWPELLPLLRREPRDEPAWREAMARLWPEIAVFCLYLTRRRRNAIQDGEDVAMETVDEIESQATLAHEIDLSTKKPPEELISKHVRKVCKRVYQRFLDREKRRLDRQRLRGDEAATSESAVPPKKGQSRAAGKARRALKQLTEQQRLLLHLHFMEGLSLGEIAGHFQVTAQAVAKRLGRAKKKLENILEAKPGRPRKTQDPTG